MAELVFSKANLGNFFSGKRMVKIPGAQWLFRFWLKINWLSFPYTILIVFQFLLVSNLHYLYTTFVWFESVNLTLINDIKPNIL